MRTRKVETDARQAEFTKGAATLPEIGKYAGTSGEYHGSWQGKVIYENGRGDNLFNRDGQEVMAYPFAYYVDRGVRDKDIDVVVIDYNQPGNPFWLRFIRDEMVATSPTTYLGKVNVWILPKTYLSLGYFALELKK
jgi:hypothetical protein